MSECERQRRRTAQHVTAAAVCKAFGLFSFQCRDIIYVYIYTCGQWKKRYEAKCAQKKHFWKMFPIFIRVSLSSGREYRCILHTTVKWSEMQRWVVNLTYFSTFSLSIVANVKLSHVETTPIQYLIKETKGIVNLCRTIWQRSKPLSRSTATLAFPSVSQKIIAAEYQLT